ncbi:uncharacterized protein LOC114516589 [Dendronephthya gigantea]|uniref:uncharacterized protein LOC114516589 n=1 Tax=Dendronephthya gigantea TaxID=151771 RepID=UPI00106BA4A8|nr:uncharacterized protein LOC114516589 [Dendronephthya gigantea]
MLYLANFTDSLWIGLKKHAAKFISTNNTGEYLEDEIWRWCYYDHNGITKREYCHRFHPSICVKRRYEGKCQEGWEMNDEYCHLNVYSLMTWFAAFAHCLAKQSEMYVARLHGNSIGATMTKQDYWIGVAERRPLKPILGWEWTDGRPLQWDEAKIVVLNYACLGCGIVRNRMVYLNRCLYMYQFLCDGDSPSANEDIHKRNYLSWEDAVLNCKEKYGNSSSLLPLSTVKFRNVLNELYSNGSIQFDKYYRIGLKDKINSSEETCTKTEISTETNMTEFRVRKCFSFVCWLRPISLVHVNCDWTLHPACVKDAKNGTNDSLSCEPSWEVRVKEGKCVRMFKNVQMRWLTAYLFCQGQNGELLPPNMVHLFNDYNTTGLSGKCWVNDYKSFLPQDPLEGWKWPNGTLLNVSYNWGLTARLRDIKKERRTWCAYVRPEQRIWEQSKCSAPLRFICKKKFLTEPSTSPGEESAHKEEMSKVMRSASELIYCQRENCTKETKEKKQSVEELISSAQREIVEIVNSSTFSYSFNTVKRNIELTVFTSEFIDLQYQRSNTTSVPTKSIAMMCQNRSSCIIKGVIMKISNITISLSKSSNNSAAQQADTMSVDYIVDGQLVNKLDEDEEVSLNFQLEEVVTGSRVMCMFLDGLLWNTRGMKVGSMGNDIVECVTNHFSSFAMVVLDSEPSEADKDALKFISYMAQDCRCKDLQILTTSRHLVHLNLQIALGLTQIVFLAGGSATHDEVGNFP